MAAPFEDGVAAAFRDHSASIERLALRSTRDPELAADVTQEAFLRLVIEAREGRFPDNVGGWLYRTSANLIVSHARHSAVERARDYGWSKAADLTLTSLEHCASRP